MILNVLKEVVKLPIDIEYATIAAENSSLKIRYFTSMPDFDLDLIELNNCSTLTEPVEGGFVTEVTLHL